MKANKYLLLITLIIGLGAGTAQAQNDLKVPLSDPGSPGKLVLSTVFSEDIVISAYDGNEVIILFDGEDEDENDEDEDGELDGPRHLDERSVTIFHLQASATAKHFTVSLHATHIHAVLEDGVHLGAKREGLKSQRVGRVRTPREVHDRAVGVAGDVQLQIALRESGRIAIIFHVVVVLVIPEETQITQRTRRCGLVFNHR